MTDNITKKPSVWRNIKLTSVSAIALLASALGGTLGTGVTRANADKIGLIQHMTLTLTNAAVAMTDHTTSGSSGGLKLYDFAIGGVLVLAATATMTVAEVGGVGASATLLCALGSATAGADATLTSTEANIIPSTSVSLTSSAGTFTGMSTGAAYLDGHTSAAALYLNMAVSDADSTDSSNDTVTCNGTVDVWFLHLTDWA